MRRLDCSPVNELFLICSLIYELTQVRTRFCISEKAKNSSQFGVWETSFEFIASSNSSETVKPKL